MRGHRKDRLTFAIEADLAEKLRRRRVALQRSEGMDGWFGPYNQKNLAKRLGISAACLCYWENGRQFPGSIDMWDSWARALQSRLAIDITERHK